MKLREFMSLPLDARDLAACLNGMAVLSLNSALDIVNIYGPQDFKYLLGLVRRSPMARGYWETEEYQKWHHAIVAAAGRLDEGHEDIQVPPPPDIMLYVNEAKLIKATTGAGTEQYFVFCRANSALGQTPQDSKWALWTYRYKAGLRQDATFYTNALGFRDDEVVSPKPEGAFRVLCLGSSTTEEGDTNATTYPNLLESMLQKKHTATHVEVVNCGIPGASTSAHILGFLDYMAMAPDLVILYEGVNDALTFGLDFWHKFEAPRYKALLSQSRFMQKVAWKLLSPGPQEVERSLEGAVTNVEILYKAFGAHGVPVVACTIASPFLPLLSSEEIFYLDYNFPADWWLSGFNYRQYQQVLHHLNNELRALGKRSGLPVLEVSENVRGGLDIFTDFCHMSPRGTQRKAEVIFAALPDI